MGSNASNASSLRHVPLAQQRRSRVLVEVGRTGFVVIGDLAGLLGVSVSTVRRDLGVLAATGALRRIHGGAMLPEMLPRTPRHLPQSSAFGLGSHDELGQAAASFVRRGATIGIGAGLLCEALARHLEAIRPLTVVTNSLRVAKALGDGRTHLTVILVGGVVSPRGVATGRHDSSTLVDIALDAYFVGCDGVDVDAGLTCREVDESVTNTHFVSAARQVIALAAQAALGHRALSTFARLADVHVLVTEPGIPQAALQRLREQIPEVVETNHRGHEERRVL